MTLSTPRRRIILQFLQMGLTLGRTFMGELNSLNYSLL